MPEPTSLSKQALYRYIESEINKLPPFNNLPTTVNNQGVIVRLLLCDTDPEYVEQPLNVKEVPLGALPPEDYVISYLINVFTSSKIASQKLTFWQKLFKPGLVKQINQNYLEAVCYVRWAAQYSSKTKAAQKRILNSLKKLNVQQSFFAEIQ